MHVYGKCLCGIAYSYGLMRIFDEADQLFKEGLRIIKNDAGELNQPYAVSLANYAFHLDLISNSLDEAIKFT